MFIICIVAVTFFFMVLGCSSFIIDFQSFLYSKDTLQIILPFQLLFNFL